MRQLGLTLVEAVWTSVETRRFFLWLYFDIEGFSCGLETNRKVELAEKRRPVYFLQRTVLNWSLGKFPWSFLALQPLGGMRSESSPPYALLRDDESMLAACADETRFNRACGQ